MKGMEKEKKLDFWFYLAAGLCMALLSLALYAGQKPYTQVYDVPLGMTGESFYLEILTRAEDIAYETNAENTEVHVFEDKERGKNQIIIERTGKAGEIKRLKLSGDTDDTKTGWAKKGIGIFQCPFCFQRKPSTVSPQFPPKTPKNPEA